MGQNGDGPRRTTLRRKRLELDLTQEAMAERMGLSRSKYSELENGKGLTKKTAPLVAQQTGQSIGDVWNEYESLQEAS